MTSQPVRSNPVAAVLVAAVLWSAVSIRFDTLHPNSPAFGPNQPSSPPGGNP